MFSFFTGLTYAENRFKQSICLFLFCLILLNQNLLLYAKTNPDSTVHLIEVINKYEGFVKEIMEEWDAPGGAVAIVKDDKIVYINGFGVRQLGRQEKVDIHTVFRLASVSKGFASVLAGLLVEDGTFKWDDKVYKYLPDFSLKSINSTRNLTIRHILSHTSGLPKHTYTNLLEEDIPIDSIFKKLGEVSLISPVGRQYSYQNVLYSLISKIIKSASNKGYNELITERIFEPLNMHDASLGREPFMATTNRAMPHIWRYFEWTATDVKNGYYSVLPSAGINASILDLARWLRAMMGGMPEVVSPQVIQQVTQSMIRTPQELRKFGWRDRLHDANYGLGWRIYDYAGEKVIYHGGWVEGFRAEIGFIPEQKIGIAVLLNYESMVANLFLPTFFDMYLDLSEPASIQIND